MAADQQSNKKKKVVQLDDASTSSMDSTPTDKISDIDFPKPPPDDSSVSPAKDPTYDPTRIPSSIFGCRQETGADWSINSNESLFSITMGNNNSFSRDHVFVVYKSGELLRLDEVFSHRTLPPLAEADNFGPERQQDLSAATGGAPPNNVSSSATPDGTDADTSSFAFPILINNKAEAIVKLPSSQGISQPVVNDPPPSGFSSWFFCSCCPFFGRK